MADPASEADAWDEWGDDAHAAHEAPAPASAPSALAPASGASMAALAAAPGGQSPPLSPRELLDWAWDLSALDAELAVLAPSAVAEEEQKTAVGADASLAVLAARAAPTQTRLAELAQRTHAMRAQAAVAQWRLRRLARGLAADGSALGVEDEDEETELAALRALAGEWGHVATPAEHAEKAAELHEMSSLLQHALAASEAAEDTAPFQQALEQLFASLPAQQLVVPVAWIRPSDPETENEKKDLQLLADAFVARLVALCDAESAGSTRVAPLSDAQLFQDTKDVQRDEVVVGGAHVAGGAVGYDAVVDAIAAHFRATLAQALPSDAGENENGTETMDATLRLAAQHVLTACNRTESGGCAYEILSQFATQHSTHRVLIRPASARAPPLEIASDVGVFASREFGWSVGLRVRVAAVTWYCVCDADDPTRELCEVQTTYTNRLAFPLGRTPLARRDLLRRDGGDVTIALRLESAVGEGEMDDVDALL